MNLHTIESLINMKVDPSDIHDRATGNDDFPPKNASDFAT